MVQTYIILKREKIEMMVCYVCVAIRETNVIARPILKLCQKRWEVLRDNLIWRAKNTAHLVIENGKVSASNNFTQDSLTWPLQKQEKM